MKKIFLLLTKPFWKGHVECPMRVFLKQQNCTFDGATMDAFITDLFGRRLKVVWKEGEGVVLSAGYQRA